jgi:hypothetical protein
MAEAEGNSIGVLAEERSEDSGVEKGSADASKYGTRRGRL